MGDPARNPAHPLPRNDPPWCEQAQADGVPCFEAGRDCEVCGRARPGYTSLDPRDRPPDGPLPLSGA